MPLTEVRNFTEYPSRAEPLGTVIFDVNAMAVLAGLDTAGYQDAHNGNITTVTGTYQAVTADGLILAGNTTNYTVTLPAIAQGITTSTSGVPKGKTIRVKKTGASGTLTVAGSGAETIDGSANVTTATQNDIIVVISDGTNWRRLNLAGTAAQQKLTVTTQAGTSFTVATTDDVTLASSTSAITATLPAASAAAGLQLRVVKTGATGVMTITRAGADTINGATTLIVTKQYATVTLVSDGTASWYALVTLPDRQAVTTVTNTATLDDGAQLVLCTGTNAYVLTLPAVANYIGKVLTIKKTGASGAITVTPVSGTIDGAATKSVSTQYAAVQLVTDGTNWFELVNAVPA